MKPYPIRMPVRYEDGTWYLRCDQCASSGQSTAYWPLALEYWNPGQGLQRCRACHNLKRRLAERRRPEHVRARNRGYYWKNRDKHRERRKRHYEAHRDEINERRRRRRHELKEASSGIPDAA